MYSPKAFQQDDPDLLKEIVRDHGFATLVTPDNDAKSGFAITHLPLLLRGQDRLIGHMARVNRHWRHLDEDKISTAIFQGPHGYVSPTWYGEAGYVPTWNYIAVHVTGTIRLFETADEMREMLERLTDQYEQGLTTRWRPQDIGEDKIQALMRGIVGFEMKIETWQGKFKLSQNKSGPAQQSLKEIMEQSDRPDDQALAMWMERLANQTDS